MPQLDGLRAVAVLAVVVYHAAPGPLFIGGYIGVDVFFVLSGFLITTLLVREHRDTGSIRLLPFYGRRLRRLYPQLVLVALFCLVTFATLRPEDVIPNATRDTLIGIPVSLTYLSTWFLGFEINSLGRLGHTWSLSVEEHFYLVWPVVLLLALRKWPRYAERIAALSFGVALTGHIAVLVVGSAPHAYFAPDARAYQMLAGCLLAVTLHRLAGLPDRLVNIAAGVAFGLLCFVTFTWHRAEGPYYVGGGLAVTAAAAVLIGYLVQRRSPASRLLSMSWPVNVGRWSYGIYLWHYPLMLLASDAIGDSSLQRFIGRVVGGAAAIGFAAACYRWVERPILRGRSARIPATGTGQAACVADRT